MTVKLVALLSLHIIIMTKSHSSKRFTNPIKQAFHTWSLVWCPEHINFLLPSFWGDKVLGLTYISIKLIKPNADLSFLLPLHLYSKFFLLTNVGTLPCVSPKMLVRDSVGILSLLRWQNKKKVVNVWSHHHTQWAEKWKKAKHSLKMKNKCQRGLEVLF